MALASAGVTRRYRLEWMLLGGVLLLVGGFLLWNRWSEHEAIRIAETQRLVGQVQAIDENLARQLEGAYAALLSMRGRRPHWGEAELRTTAVRRMTALADAMPGVRTLQILDADGVVLASNREELIGRRLADRPYFQQARAGDDPAVLYVSAPFRTVLGVWALNLSLVLQRPDGAFDGLVSATLDPEYFDVALHSVLYAPDMLAEIIHGDGEVLQFSPPRADVQGRNLAQPGSPFVRHLDSGQVATVFDEVLPMLGEHRLLAQRTLRPAGVPMDRPLVLGASRSVVAMYAPWRQQTALYAALYAMLALVSCGGLWALQRHQRELDAAREAQQAQQRADAERLELALRGADLGLWDMHVPSGRTVVNARWKSMLGLAPDVEGDAARWAALVHTDDWPRVKAAQEAHLRGETERYEAIYRIRHADGRWLWLLDRGQVTERDAAGQPLRMVGTHLDISGQMQAQQALQRSEQSLAITLQSIGDGVVATDARGCVTRMNLTAERLTGWAATEAFGQPLSTVFRIVNARQRQPVADPVRRVLDSGAVVELANDTLLLARDGAEYQIADTAAPIRTGDGEVVGVVLVFSDVTQRYRAEQALRERERLLSTITDALPGPVSRVDREGRYLFANAAYERWFGVDPRQVIGRTQREVLGRYHADVEPYVQRALAGETVQYEGRVQTTTGELRALVTLVPDRDGEGRVQGHYTVVIDITERKRAEEAARAGEARMRALLDALDVGVTVHGADGGVVDANPAACRILGLTASQIRGEVPPAPGWSFVDADGASLPPSRHPAALVLASGQPVKDFVAALRRPDREQLAWLSGEAFPLRDVRGHIEQVVVTFSDITERRLAQQRILAAQVELEATLAAVPDLLYEVDLDGVVHGLHSGRPELLVRPAEQQIGRTLSELLPPDALAVVTKALRQAHAEGRSSGLQYELQLPDGSVHGFELSVAPKPVPEGETPRFVVLARDISDRQRIEAERALLERQLREAQKMEAIGTLAGGIAHDFNNILASILGNVGLAREDLGAGHPAQALLEQIQRSGVRARDLVQQILTFSRRQPQPLRRLPLQPAVREAMALLRATLPAGVRLDLQLAEPPIEVDADATQLQQVLINLCTNAWHALPAGGGRIEVGVDLAPCPLPERRPADASPHGRCAHLWVRDDGSGMDAATRERIFDPFFTTKPVGQGTGLGLAVVHGIVQAHRGAITLDSTPGAGSCFHVWLPLPVAPPPEPVAIDQADPVAGGAGQRVVYVDDDEVMLALVERLLQRAGYRAAVFAHPRRALEQLEADPQSVDLVITDHNMPEMSGLELARRLSQLRPDLPLVLSSGYLSDALRLEAERLGVRALLQKEHTFEQLATTVARVLAEATPRGR